MSSSFTKFTQRPPVEFVRNTWALEKRNSKTDLHIGTYPTPAAHFFYRRTEHGSFIAYQSCMRRNFLWCSGQGYKEQDLSGSILGRGFSRGPRYEVAGILQKQVLFLCMFQQASPAAPLTCLLRPSGWSDDSPMYVPDSMRTLKVRWLSTIRVAVWSRSPFSKKLLFN